MPYHSIFACGPNVAVNAIAELPFLKATRSIMDMNDNIHDMTKVNGGPLSIEFCVTCTTTPATGTHIARTDEDYYGMFVEELDEVLVHVNKVFMALIEID